MASTNKTTHYDLPQWIGTDKPTFLGDLNGAFSTIDTQLYTAVTNAENANNNATSAAGAVSNMQNDVNDLKTWKGTASSAISGLQTQVTNLGPTIGSQTQLISGLGNLLSSNSPSITSNTSYERLITIGSLKLLNMYGVITVSYTGSPVGSSVMNAIPSVVLSNVYSKYSIDTTRIFYNIATLDINDSEDNPLSINLGIRNVSGNTQLLTTGYFAGTLKANHELYIRTQCLVVIN